MKEFKTEQIRMNGWRIPVDVPTRTMSEKEFIERVSKVAKNIKKR